jgi:hypothetical protein
VRRAKGASRRVRGCGAALLGAALIALACAPRPGRLLVVPLTPLTAVVTYEDLAAMAASDMVPSVAALLAETFAAPLPRAVTLGLYRTRLAFTTGLVHDVGLSPRMALDVSRTALGFALPRTVLLLTGEGAGDHVRLVAHEMMHVSQMELAGPGGRPTHWILEGTAEWGALTLLQHLGAPAIESRMGVARAIGLRYLTDHPRFSLASVRRSDDFRRWQRAAGDLVAYHVSYALAEQLVARHGLPAVLTYFRAYRHSEDHVKNFQRAFGSSPEDFIAAARGSMSSLPRPTS